jgi:hypothetical protein
MADVSDEHTLQQSKTLMGVSADDPGWSKLATAAYMIGAKHSVIPKTKKKLSNVEKLAMFNTLSKVSEHPYHYQRTNPDAVRSVHGSNPHARQEHRLERQEQEEREEREEAPSVYCARPP